ncbi:MAG: hypothetical protein ISN28_09865 [Ectothiorhodospiraceae bacterium AqS1]|nr:hypothetical protein [Ectothiorhodospiraceae bacterium AqS1]
MAHGFGRVALRRTPSVRRLRGFDEFDNPEGSASSERREEAIERMIKAMPSNSCRSVERE